MHSKHVVFYVLNQSAMDRRSWQQQSSGLMPVLEEDEESADWSGGEEGKPAEEAHTEGKTHNQNKQVIKGLNYTNWNG